LVEQLETESILSYSLMSLRLDTEMFISAAKENNTENVHDILTQPRMKKFIYA